jgi:TldD protein
MDEREFVLRAVDAARERGASFAEARLVRGATEGLAVRNGEIVTFETPEDAGFSVRVLRSGAWGFAASHRIATDAVAAAVGRAVAAAEHLSVLCRDRPVEIAPAPAAVATWASPCEIDPFGIPLDRKIEILLKCDEGLRRSSEVVATSCAMQFVRRVQWYANTEGSVIEQTSVRSGAGIAARAAGHGEVQVRSYPTSFGGQYEAAGWELVERLDLPGAVERVREEAVALLRAAPCPPGRHDLILGSSQLALQIHESCGHPAELDRVLGWEVDLAGDSFLTLDRLGRFEYGSEHVTLVADATIPGGVATFAFDDEGVPAGRWPIVERGILKGYLTSREAAKFAGETVSRGAARAESWSHFPIIRMVNLSLEPGTWDFEELVADTEDGVLCDTVKSWSIDQRRLNFQFTTEIGWEIRAGKRTRLLKNPTYQGKTPEFWRSCDAVCSAKHFQLWGVPNCGKGNPMQVVGMSHGAAPARFRGVVFVG